MKTLLIAALFLFSTAKISSAQDRYLYMSGDSIEHTFVHDSANQNYSMASWNYSFIGNYKKALEYFDKSVPIQRHSRIDSLENRILSPGREFLIEKARSHQIVIINEAHHQPAHRVFTESLLEELYKIGYRYLGLEALAEDSLINIRKWPLIGDGFYTCEPQFGNMIRKALKIGFEVFGYDHPVPDIPKREKGQAANIARMVRKDPAARFLIHCGFGHVRENQNASNVTMMAGELKSLTHLDPLTIDQVLFTEHSAPGFEHMSYEYYPVNVPSVLLDSLGNLASENDPDSWVDAEIVHPRTRYVAGRPSWLLRNNAWRLFNLATISTSLAPPYLVSAYLKEEFDTNSVPVDQIEAETGHESLVLPSGKFELVLRDRSGNFDRVSIEVTP